MIRNLLGYRVIHSLRNLIHQSHKVFVENTGAIQIPGSPDEIRESLGCCRPIYTVLYSWLLSLLLFEFNRIPIRLIRSKVTNKFVRFAPSLDRCGKKRMTESKGRCCKCVNHSGIHRRVVSIPVILNKTK